MRGVLEGIDVGSVKICSRPRCCVQASPRSLPNPGRLWHEADWGPPRRAGAYWALVDDEVPLAGVVASYLEPEQFEVSVTQQT